nr:hypothetical protein [Tanacetum cinerariifolium]
MSSRRPPPGIRRLKTQLAARIPESKTVWMMSDSLKALAACSSIIGVEEIEEEGKGTFPSLAREDGSEDQEAPPSVNRLLLSETLTKFPGKPLADASADDFLPDDGFCLLCHDQPLLLSLKVKNEKK